MKIPNFRFSWNKKKNKLISLIKT